MSFGRKDTIDQWKPIVGQSPDYERQRSVYRERNVIIMRVFCDL